jgi:uncharacterized protein YigE (DUF2233 family)
MKYNENIMKKKKIIIAIIILVNIKISYSQIKETNIKYNNNKYIVISMYKNYERIKIISNLNKNCFNTEGIIKSMNMIGIEPLYIINGGMYLENMIPQGLLVDSTKIISEINLSFKNDHSNFYNLPNGIFLTKQKSNEIIKSIDYSRNKYKVINATQSGPFLVFNEAINRKFKKKSKSINYRLGVGISKKNNELYFVLSDTLVNMYAFSDLFRNHLKCENALYLDGKVTNLYSKNKPENTRIRSLYATSIIIY